MLTSLRTVREISRSSILVEQGRLIANPNWPLKKSNSESHTLRRIWRPWMSFRLGWLISPLWVCLRRKYRMAARVAGPVVILCFSPGFASAACPVGLITNATATLTNADNCPAGLQAGTGGVIDVPSGATVTIGPAGTTASNGGKISFDGAANISTTAPIRSVQADGATSLINGMTRPTITATGLIGDPSAAVYAVNGGRIELANGFVATGTGINASTVTADGVGSFVDATHGSQIIMNVDPAGNNNSEAVQMLRGGLVKLDASTTLEAVGPQAAGLKIDGTMVPLGTMDGLTVNVIGDPNSTDDALGVWATNQVSGVAAVVNVDHLTVTGVSPRSLGLFTISSTINATNSNITVNGAGGVGAAAALNGGTINLTNSTLTLNGPGAGAVRARNQFGASATNIFTASGGSITSLQSPALIAQGGLLDATLSNGVTVTGNGRLVSAVTGPLTPGDPSTDAPSTINLVGTTGAILNGDAFAEPLNIVNISLASGAKWNGAALNVTNVDVGADSSWSMTADSTVTQTVTNAGLIQFGDFMTLTTQNYAGLGGTLGLNTYLGSDGSPSDRLVISAGSATGNTIVRVTNAGGPGAETTGDGIQVVSAINGAMTSASAFALPAGELRAGAFDYDLFRGGAGGSRPNDWFLRSDFVGGGGGTGGGGGGVPLPVPPFPIDPPPNPLPPSVEFPIIGPELATYGVVQPLARQLGLSILGTLDDRVGDTYEPDGCAVQPAVPPNALPKPGGAPGPCPLFAPAVWGRFFGQTIDNHYQAFADPRASGNLGGFQGGIDLLRGSLLGGHYDRAGLYGAYGDVNADVNGLVTNPAATAYVLTHTGSMNLTAWSAGGYWTHTGPGGWYLDAVLQGTWYYGSAGTQFAKLNTDGTGFIGSLEGGYPFSWPQLGPGFVIEPQGQILWQKVSFRHDYDGLGDVALGDTTGPSGRIGLRTKWTIATAGGQVWQPYLRANLWRDWGAEADAVYSGTDVVPLLSQTTMLELGGGLTGRINAAVSVFANVDYQFAVGAAENVKRNGVRGAFGARYSW